MTQKTVTLIGGRLCGEQVLVDDDATLAVVEDPTEPYVRMNDGTKRRRRHCYRLLSATVGYDVQQFFIEKVV